MTMVAKEVPIATKIKSDVGSARIENTKTNAGTTTNPPPFPNKPAVIPANAPAMRSVIKSGSNSTITYLVSLRAGVLKI